MRAGDILYISGRTGKYLEPAAGKANWNIHAMARTGLRHEMSWPCPRRSHVARASSMRQLNGAWAPMAARWCSLT
jgi:two-component system CheB/CheR fusion protein